MLIRCDQVEVGLLEQCMRARGYDPRTGSAQAAPLDFTGDCLAPLAKERHLDLVRAAHQVRAPLAHTPLSCPICWLFL